MNLYVIEGDPDCCLNEQHYVLTDDEPTLRQICLLAQHTVVFEIRSLLSGQLVAHEENAVVSLERYFVTVLRVVGRAGGMNPTVPTYRLS